MMIKREWRQLLEMIKFSLGKGKAPENLGRRAWRCLHVDRRCGDFCSFSGKHHNHLPAFLSYAPEKEAVMSVFYLNLS